MTIQEFDRLLQEQGSEIQQDYGMLKRTEVRQAFEDTSPDNGWDPWS